MTMAELHQVGGVPPGWHFTPPAGDIDSGRKVFADFGCNSCHSVQGEQFPSPSAAQNNVGPDLTGMGSHHPAEYFAESILNPNAVLVDGPGYIGPDGRSVMPVYPTMTLAQLADLVAYLQSLTVGGTAHTHRAGGSATVGGASSFFVQAYEVKADRLDAFYDWFEQQRFRDYDGLLSVQTYAGRSRNGFLLVSLFGFDNDLTLNRFLAGIGNPDRQPGDFVRPVDRYILRSPPVYKSAVLSTQ